MSVVEFTRIRIMSAGPTDRFQDDIAKVKQAIANAEAAIASTVEAFDTALDDLKSQHERELQTLEGRHRKQVEEYKTQKSLCLEASRQKQQAIIDERLVQVETLEKLVEATERVYASRKTHASNDAAADQSNASAALQASVDEPSTLIVC